MEEVCLCREDDRRPTVRLLTFSRNKTHKGSGPDAEERDLVRVVFET